MKKNKNGKYPTSESMDQEYIEIVKLLFQYSISKNVILMMNRRVRSCEKLLFWSVLHNDIEITKLVMDYSKKNFFKLNINRKSKNNEHDLFYTAVKNNNDQMVMLILDYAKLYNIKLNINDQEKDEKDPLYWAIYHKNYTIAEIIINYVKENDINLDMKKRIDGNGDFPLLMAI